MRQNIVHSKFYFAAEGGGILFTQRFKKYSLAGQAAKRLLGQPHTFERPPFGSEITLSTY